MDILLSLVKVMGSLGIFLFGMKMLSEGLQKSAAESLHKILDMMTGNRFFAVLTGFLITVVIQSSSAATVMVVSFVDAGLMGLVSAIGVILGANIGTTVTGWIVAFFGFSMDITSLALASAAVSLPLMFSKKVRMRDYSEVFLGFGLLFMGLKFIQASSPDISSHPEILSFLSTFEDGSFLSIAICVLIGTIVTIIVQSSSATMAITITMAFQGWIGVWTASALCLGQNIGTTVTAYLASLGASTNAKRAATGHILFNVIGSVLVLFLMKPMMYAVNHLTPGDIFSMESQEMRIALPTFLAAFHTFFNLFNTVIFFPFVRPFAALIERIVPEKKKYKDDTYHFSHLGGKRTEAPEFYLVALEGETRKLGELSSTMFSLWQDYSKGGGTTETVEKLKAMEEKGDQMQEQLTDFSVSMLQNSQSPTSASDLHRIIRVIDELESITDSIFNLTKLTQDRLEKGIVFSDEERNEIAGYRTLTGEYLDFVVNGMGNPTPELLEEARRMEAKMDSEHKRLGNEVHIRLQESKGDFRTQLLILEIERNLEHIGDYLMNIAETLYPHKTHQPQMEKA